MDRNYRLYQRGEMDFVTQRRMRVIEALDLDPTDTGGADEVLALMEAQVERAWVLFPEVRAVLEGLGSRGVPVGLVTNGEGRMQRKKLRSLGIQDHFAAILISEELGLRKPQPEIFWEACRRLGSSPKRTLMVGDNPVADIGGALGAGLGALWFNHRGEPGEHPQIRTLGELADHWGD